MSEFADKIKDLLQQLDLIKKRQNFLGREILKIEQQIESLKISAPADNDSGHVQAEIPDSQEIVTEASELRNTPPAAAKQADPQLRTAAKTSRTPQSKSEMERFIGENLISVIGISVLVIGIAIGVKYAIDKDMISPLSRILLGYGACFALLIVALYLRKNYQHFSAVMLSGAMAGFYFVSFVAYDFYALVGKIPAFGLMVAITVSTVFAALHYNRQIIAQLGLVGAYAIPFLLDDGKGEPLSLFTYMTIINAGILYVAINKYWRPLYYSSFILSWLIFLGWYFNASNAGLLSSNGPIFLTIFFAIFYATFLFYKIIRKEQFRVEDVIFLFLNVFIFYGIGMDILQERDHPRSVMAFFTAFNALIHGLVSYVIYKQENSDRKIMYLTIGLSLLFITMAVPVYWDGNWVTLIWMGEAVILFWTGTKMSNKSFRTLSFVMTILAVLSLFQDWETNYDQYFNTELFTSFLNINFFSSLLCAAALGYMGLQKSDKLLESASGAVLVRDKTFTSVLQVLAVLVLYLAGYNEISYFWEKKFQLSMVSEYDSVLGYETTTYQWDYKNFKTLWLIIYTMLFLSAIGFFNLKVWRIPLLGKIHLVLTGIVLLLFLIGGLYEISELRDIYLGRNIEITNAGIFHLLIRYIAIASAAIMMLSAGMTLRSAFNTFKVYKIFDISVALLLFGVLSSELYHWMDVYGFEDFHKLGLSIFWGSFAVGMVGIGIYWRKQHLRVAAIVLFSCTLIKLFFYDISHLNTISKTVVFVSLGVLLLIISFLYNKYKHLMLDEDEKNQIS
ncbi:MAG: DUF2339 domain-containing protein [Saprospiraceae bacterium]|nr:DUF2339 domain-containing protein [Saprospiraceae bacterium]